MLSGVNGVSSAIYDYQAPPAQSRPRPNQRLRARIAFN